MTSLSVISIKRIHSPERASSNHRDVSVSEHHSKTSWRQKHWLWREDCVPFSPRIGAAFWSQHQWSFFQNLNILFLDTLSQQIIFLIIEITIFWGDLSSISAKTATLISMCSPTCSFCMSSAGSTQIPRGSCLIPFYPQRNKHQWCRFSGNIASVTPKTIHFYYQKKYLQDQGIQK